ncbi:MAG: efflux RND transporter periplasmic adaptor subunit [Planctomycetales bacterium]|nr:efflux RND transporter periplasmic adaptor subunit [Planctomycetales bacterium]
MKQSLSKLPAGIWWTAGIILLVVLAAVTWTFWYPAANSAVDATIAVFRPSPKPTGNTQDGEAENDHSDHSHADPDHNGHDHANHEHTSHNHDAHEHAGHDEASSLSLSTQGMRNIGLTPDYLKPLSLQTFRKSITVPAVIVERPGRTQVQVATPMTGVVTHVHAVQGEAVEPGSLLFQIRLTHEDLVQAQTEFLKTLGELDVEEREIARLRDVTTSGAVAGKLVLEREYARDRLTALLLAQREALRLHGLSEQQVEQIAQQRRLLRELQVFAPSIDAHDEDEIKLTARRVQPVVFQPEIRNPPPAADARTAEPPAAEAPLVIQQLNVHKGQSVNAGETLCILADYQELFIEGLAFEQDVAHLRRASADEVSVDAILQQSGDKRERIEGLTIAYLANQVDQDSRTLRFYVRLPNTIAKDHTVEGNRYVQWEYLPGQRLQLRVPVESWPGQMVLPVDAVAREGAEFFVFKYQDGHFDRVPIHVKYRDQYSVVVADDGSLSRGDVVALRGAHQMQMAIKNKSGGGVDPHAGHNH